MKIVSVVGARPQFIKAAAVSRALRRHHQEFLVHTGQHYDYTMSGIFFDGLELPPVDKNLNVGSGSHAEQTAAMLTGIAKILLKEAPDFLLIYGDTNSTLAGALAAAKLSIPIAHVEAGLRSFNREMPEEINRVLADHVSELLLCPSNTAVENLRTEGVREGVHLVGDVMLDVLNWAKVRAQGKQRKTLQDLEIEEGKYILTTVHRSENTNDLARLAEILRALNSFEEPVIFPAHPRVRKVMADAGFSLGPHIRTIDPVGYLDMVTLTGGARLVLTDSGGVQKEAYWLGTPCVTMRDETEWVETVDAGWNVLAGADSEKIVDLAGQFRPVGARPDLYGDGFAAERCVGLLVEGSSANSEAPIESRT